MSSEGGLDDAVSGGFWKAGGCEQVGVERGFFADARCQNGQRPLQAVGID
jgi:hypothetical protein